MARHPDDVQMQLVMVPSLRRALGKAALKLQDDVDRHKLMDRGPMLLYLASWFLAQEDDTQLSIVLAGKEAFEAKYSRRHGVVDEPEPAGSAGPAASSGDEPISKPRTGVGKGKGRIGDVKADRKRADKAK